MCVYLSIYPYTHPSIYISISIRWERACIELSFNPHESEGGKLTW